MQDNRNLNVDYGLWIANGKVLIFSMPQKKSVIKSLAVLIFRMILEEILNELKKTSFMYLNSSMSSDSWSRESSTGVDFELTTRQRFSESSMRSLAACKVRLLVGTSLI